MILRAWGSGVSGGKKIATGGGDAPGLVFRTDGFGDGNEKRFIGKIKEFDAKAFGVQTAETFAAEELEKERGGETVLIGRFTIAEYAQAYLFALFGGKMHGEMEYWSNGEVEDI